MATRFSLKKRNQVNGDNKTIEKIGKQAENREI
jgi:hypothetical protein